MNPRAGLGPRSSADTVVMHPPTGEQRVPIGAERIQLTFGAMGIRPMSATGYLPCGTGDLPACLPADLLGQATSLSGALDPSDFECGPGGGKVRRVHPRRIATCGVLCSGVGWKVLPRRSTPRTDAWLYLSRSGCVELVVDLFADNGIATAVERRGHGSVAEVGRCFDDVGSRSREVRVPWSSSSSTYRWPRRRGRTPM